MYSSTALSCYVLFCTNTNRTRNDGVVRGCGPGPTCVGIRLISLCGLDGCLPDPLRMVYLLLWQSGQLRRFRRRVSPVSAFNNNTHEIVAGTCSLELYVCVSIARVRNSDVHYAVSTDTRALLSRKHLTYDTDVCAMTGPHPLTTPSFLVTLLTQQTRQRNNSWHRSCMHKVSSHHFIHTFRVSMPQLQCQAHCS